MTDHTGFCEGLNGVKGIITVLHVDSVTAMLNKALPKYRAGIASGDYGCVMAWRDDNSLLHADFQRFCKVVDKSTFKNKSALKAWLSKWLPKIHQRPD